MKKEARPEINQEETIKEDPGLSGCGVGGFLKLGREIGSEHCDEIRFGEPVLIYCH